MNSMVNLISKERLDSYEKILKITDEQQKIMAYQWSKGIVSSILPALQCIEITLRNSINYNVINKKPRAGKFSHDDLWFKSLAEYHTKKLQAKKIKKLKKRLKDQSITQAEYSEKEIKIKSDIKSWEEREILKTKSKINKLKGIEPSHNDIISGLTFGFWTNLLSDTYEDNSQEQLWPNLINEVFPNLPEAITKETTGKQREIVENRINSIRDFRNRIFHHEPVWKFFNNKSCGKPDYQDPIYGVNASLSILNNVYKEMLEVISWMSIDRFNAINKHDTSVAFSSLCTKDGLHSYIQPEKMMYSYNKSQAKRQKKQIQKNILENNSMVRITKGEDTLFFIDRRNVAMMNLI